MEKTADATVGRVNGWYGVSRREYSSRASRLKRSPSKRSQSDGVPSNGQTQKIRLCPMLSAMSRQPCRSLRQSRRSSAGC
eukprot:scaffold4448_cov115-Isochrysis_galbana.AAC.1